MAPLAGFLTVLSVYSLLLVPVHAVLLDCGAARYDPSAYTCYNDHGGLCPIVNGERTLLCGLACYSKHMYSCNNGALAELPLASGPFTLTASHPGAPFNGKTIEAGGLGFNIGAAAASYCPSPPVPIAACPPGNTTVLFGTALDVEVPGGQNIFVQTTGALAFTQAHSASEPLYDSQDLRAYSGAAGGAYYGPGGVSWVACPATDEPGVWRVFADIPSLTFAANCTGFYALAHEVPAGTIGAWEYV